MTVFSSALDKRAIDAIRGCMATDKPGPRPSIRRYDHVNDYLPIQHLSVRMHQESKYAHIPLSYASVYEFLSSIQGSNTEAFVAEHIKHGIIGFVAVMLMPLVFSPAHLAHDLALYVAPEFRHTLAFAGLIRAAERWAKRHNAQSIIFGISAPHDPARVARAYKKLGYVEVGVSMRKEIAT